jgi:hypothetical protein
MSSLNADDTAVIHAARFLNHALFLVNVRRPAVANYTRQFCEQLYNKIIFRLP